MARLGMFCLPWIGHLNPFSTLAHELIGRGHQITFFHVADSAVQVRNRGFQFEAFGERDYPAGTFAERYRELSRLDGLPAIRASLSVLTSQAEALFTTARPVIEKAKLDLWIVDHLDYAAATLAAQMQAPFVSVIVGLMMHQEDGVPGFSGELYTNDPVARERDRRSNEAILAAAKPFRDYLSSYRVKAGMGPFSYNCLWSGLAQITQQPAEFEFPRRNLPACFHFAGPFARRYDRPPTPFPWDRLSGKPLIFASFGTTQNRNWHLYDAVVKAAADLDAQVVLSLGGAETVELPKDLPGNLLVVPFAPQLDILEKATLMITHAGMNSALECLAAGVPMVAVPIAHDQHGVSARIEWTGTGVRIPASECEPARLRQAIETVLGEASFRESARRFRRIIGEGDGLNRAADIIERVAATGRPVLRGESFAESPGPTAAAGERQRRAP
ncbi:MAG: nucleotide disphospho-sugar-binding domain-containing protein [Bryobacteraceae bacterium]